MGLPMWRQDSISCGYPERVRMGECQGRGSNQRKIWGPRVRWFGQRYVPVSSSSVFAYGRTSHNNDHKRVEQNDETDGGVRRKGGGEGEEEEGGGGGGGGGRDNKAGKTRLQHHAP